jgi:hypothetical protein
MPAGIHGETKNWCGKTGKINEVCCGIREESLHESPGLVCRERQKEADFTVNHSKEKRRLPCLAEEQRTRTEVLNNYFSYGIKKILNAKRKAFKLLGKRLLNRK